MPIVRLRQGSQARTLPRTRSDSEADAVDQRRGAVADVIEQLGQSPRLSARRRTGKADCRQPAELSLITRHCLAPRRARSGIDRRPPPRVGRAVHVLTAVRAVAAIAEQLLGWLGPPDVAGEVQVGRPE